EVQASPISPLALVGAVADAVPDDAIIVDESISSSHGVRNLFRTQDQRGFYGLRGGGIGGGLPAPPGVKPPHPAASSPPRPPAPGWGSSATAAPCTRSRRCGRRRTTPSPASTSSSTT